MRSLIRPSFWLCLLLLVAAELLLRCTLSPLSVAAFQYGYHPDSGFEEGPNGTVHLVPGPARKFYAQTFSRSRPPGVFRIVTLGSSVEYSDAMGSFILSNTYPAQMGEELRRRGIATESINLGITGYGMQRNAVLFRKALAYQPSLIILKLDVTNEGVDETNRERSREYLNLAPQNWLWKSYLLQTGLKLKEDPLLVRCLPGGMLRQTAKQTAKKSTAASQPGLSPFSATTSQAIGECLRLARQQGVPVLLLTQAYVVNDAQGRRASTTDHQLDAYAAELCGPGIDALSLKQMLAPFPIEEAFTDHVHLTRPMHKFVAGRLADWVEDAGLTASAGH
jgi:hypothetical protein